ncbi:MAG: hypothetical protein GY754_38010 [bacterium]|nr:hypothetical protein [bacterium]
MKRIIIMLLLGFSSTLLAQSHDNHAFMDDGVLDYGLERKNVGGSSEIARLKDMISGKATVGDKTIPTILNRNKQWKNMLIVSDLTGSMTPHTAQLVIWLKLNMMKRETKSFAFFNDGDAKRTSSKKIGKTGGIYTAKADTFEDVAELAYKTMNGGGGGDGPENDIEALMAGIKKFGDCSEIVLIADNKSNMRDISLLKKLKRPVRVVLCGTFYGINIQYLELARATGGSVHTIEEDILSLMKLKEGQSIKIGKSKYLIRKGKFIKMKTI